MLEEIELPGVRRGHRDLLLRPRRRGRKRDARVIPLQAREDRLGTVDHARGKPGEPRDLNAVASVRRAGNHPAHEHDLVVPFLDGDRQVAHPQEVPVQLRELLVVRGEEGPGPPRGVAMQVFDDRPRDAKPVIGRCPAANLVQNDQRAVGGVVEDVRRLVHLDHEGRVPARQVVAGPDPGEDPVHHPEPA